jgi:hypothetical protein
MHIPLVIITLVYRVAHLEDWPHIEAVILLLFQAAIVGVSLALILGHFLMAAIVLGGFAVFLGLFAGLAKNI